MPLLSGKSNRVVSANISELRHSGYKRSQAIAIALDKAGRGRKHKTMKPGAGPRMEKSA